MDVERRGGRAAGADRLLRERILQLSVRVNNDVGCQLPVGSCVHRGVLSTSVRLFCRLRCLFWEGASLQPEQWMRRGVVSLILSILRPTTFYDPLTDLLIHLCYSSAADSMGAECGDCNAPCIEEFNECAGLPQIDIAPVSGCANGREGVDDPTCTLALREQTCEGWGFGAEECNALSCCQWDAVAEICSAACVIPDDGAACCVLVESSDTSNPTLGPTAGGTVSPTASPTSKPTAPAPAPDNSRDGPSGSTISRPAGVVASISVAGLLVWVLA